MFQTTVRHRADGDEASQSGVLGVQSPIAWRGLGPCIRQAPNCGANPDPNPDDYCCHTAGAVDSVHPHKEWTCLYLFSVQRQGGRRIGPIHSRAAGTQIGILGETWSAWQTDSRHTQWEVLLVACCRARFKVAPSPNLNYKHRLRVFLRVPRQVTLWVL